DAADIAVEDGLRPIPAARRMRIAVLVLLRPHASKGELAARQLVCVSGTDRRLEPHEEVGVEVVAVHHARYGAHMAAQVRTASVSAWSSSPRSSRSRAATMRRARRITHGRKDAAEGLPRGRSPRAAVRTLGSCGGA